jgi:hypothetical protein
LIGVAFFVRSFGCALFYFIIFWENTIMNHIDNLWYSYCRNKDKTDDRELASLFHQLRKSLTADEQERLLLDYAVAILSSAYDREKAAFIQGLHLGHDLALENQNPSNT